MREIKDFYSDVRYGNFSFKLTDHLPILYANDTFYEITNYTKEDVRRGLYFDNIVEEKKKKSFSKWMKESFLIKKEYSFTIDLFLQDGTKKTFIIFGVLDPTSDLSVNCILFDLEETLLVKSLKKENGILNKDYTDFHDTLNSILMNSNAGYVFYNTEAEEIDFYSPAFIECLKVSPSFFQRNDKAGKLLYQRCMEEISKNGNFVLVNMKRIFEEYHYSEETYFYVSKISISGEHNYATDVLMFIDTTEQQKNYLELSGKYQKNLEELTQYKALENLTGAFYIEYNEENDSVVIRGNNENIQGEYHIDKFYQKKKYKDYGFTVEICNIFKEIRSLDGKKGILDLQVKLFNSFEKSWYRISFIKDKQGICYGYIFDVNNEYVERKKILETVEKDPLTGLLHQNSFIMKTKDYLDSCNIKKNNAALFVIDIDRFKGFNDYLGHLAGDKVLKDVTKILVSTFRSTDFIGRLGGDEFVVFLRDCPRKSAIRLAQELSNNIHKEYTGINGKKVSLSASVGVSLYPIDGVKYEELFQKADEAMYRVKHSGKDNYCFFNEEDLLEINSSVNNSIRSGNALKNKILVVGCVENRQHYSLMLGDSYDVLFANNGYQGLEEALKNKDYLDLIMLDTDIEDISFSDFITTIRHEYFMSEISIILLTNNPDFDLNDCGEGLNVCDVLLKNTYLKVYGKRIENYISLTQVRRDMNSSLEAKNNEVRNIHSNFALNQNLISTVLHAEYENQNQKIFDFRIAMVIEKCVHLVLKRISFMNSRKFIYQKSDIHVIANQAMVYNIALQVLPEEVISHTEKSIEEFEIENGLSSSVNKELYEYVQGMKKQMDENVVCSKDSLTGFVFYVNPKEAMPLHFEMIVLSNILAFLIIKYHETMEETLTRIEQKNYGIFSQDILDAIVDSREQINKNIQDLIGK